MINQFNLGLEASKKLQELLGEVETEKYWVGSDELAWDLMGKDELPDYPLWNDPTKIISAPNLAELSEVFRMLGEKKGWGYQKSWSFLNTRDKEGEDELGKEMGLQPDFIKNYLELCELWATTQSQQACDEFVINLIQK